MSDRADRAELASYAELAIHGVPTNVDDLIAMGARVALSSGPVPTEELHICAGARGLAEGLFGEAFFEASEIQQLEWVEKCERAIRAELIKRSDA